jgi:hypothetical protein
VKISVSLDEDIDFDEYEELGIAPGRRSFSEPLTCGLPTAAYADLARGMGRQQ